jgi:hypothetical protein
MATSTVLATYQEQFKGPPSGQHKDTDSRNRNSIAEINTKFMCAAPFRQC